MAVEYAALAPLYEQLETSTGLPAGFQPCHVLWLVPGLSNQFNKEKLMYYSPAPLHIPDGFLNLVIVAALLG